MGIGPGSGLRQTIGRPGDLADDSITGSLMSLLRNIDDEVENVERHIYNYERWRGVSADQSGENWAADNLNPFVLTSGNNAYGPETRILGRDDTPIFAGRARYDVHRILVVGQTSVTPWKVRLAFGSGTLDEAIAADQYTEVCHVPLITLGAWAGGAVLITIMPRLLVGVDRMWAQAWNATDAALMGFLLGVREHEG